jgi:hypothetical protein
MGYCKKICDTKKFHNTKNQTAMAAATLPDIDSIQKRVCGDLPGCADTVGLSSGVSFCSR